MISASYVSLISLIKIVAGHTCIVFPWFIFEQLILSKQPISLIVWTGWVGWISLNNYCFCSFFEVKSIWNQIWKKNMTISFSNILLSILPVRYFFTRHRCQELIEEYMVADYLQCYFYEIHLVIHAQLRMMRLCIFKIANDT